MRPESRVRFVYMACFVLVFVVVVAVIFYIATTPGPPAPTSLPIPAGTVIRPPFVEVSFAVEGGRADLVGAWYASGGGLFWFMPENMTTGPISPECGPGLPWNGSVNASIQPGAYVLGFAPNPRGGPITITRTIRLVYPSTSEDRSVGEVMGQGCIPPNIIGAPPR